MKIHLNSKPGMYTVVNYNDTYITLTTAKHYAFQVPCSDFKCFAGGFNNSNISTEETDKFLATVNPSMFKHQAKMTESIMEAVKALSMQPMQHANNNEPVDEADNIQYENWFHQKCDEIAKLEHKMFNTAVKVYKQKLDFTDLLIDNGAKFIIQQHRETKSYRFRFDPYRFVSNAHSMISNIFREYNWETINGGWIKVINKNVVLYSKSGDYGVYDDNIAVEAAKSVFPNHKIFSYAGRRWDDELTDKYDDLPF
jgi:hypothetical protein